MKGSRSFVIFLVLSTFLLFTTEAARGRSGSSNQNSFRRAANGVYQTLSSVFGEENIRAMYKVSGGHMKGIARLVLVMSWRAACSLHIVNRK